MTDGPNPANDRVEVYPHTISRDGTTVRVLDWRRLDMGNGQVVSTSGGQGYDIDDPGYALACAKAYNVGVQRFDVLDHDPNADDDPPLAAEGFPVVDTDSPLRREWEGR